MSPQTFADEKSVGKDQIIDISVPQVMEDWLFNFTHFLLDFLFSFEQFFLFGENELVKVMKLIDKVVDIYKKVLELWEMEQDMVLRVKVVELGLSTGFNVVDEVKEVFAGGVDDSLVLVALAFELLFAGVVMEDLVDCEFKSQLIGRFEEEFDLIFVDF